MGAMEEKLHEIKQVSETEIWVGATKLYLDEDKIIHVDQVSAPDKKQALLEVDAYYKIANLVDGKVGMLIDINKSGKPSHDARKIYQRAVENEKFGKVAFIGLHPVAKVMATFVMGVTKKKDIYYFNTKEEALAWLKEGE
jgi:hypothetical protein